MTKHTTTPWAVDDPHQVFAPVIGEYVAITDVEGDGRTPFAANAAFIVRAVNSHDTLVAALNSIANNTCCEGCGEAAKVARAALAYVTRGTG